MSRTKTTTEIILTVTLLTAVIVLLWVEFRPRPEITLVHYEAADANESSIPMEFHNGSLFVKCLVNEKPATMKIDTGANICVFDVDKLDHFGIQKAGSSRSVRLTGNVHVESWFLQPFTIDFPSVGIKAHIKLADSNPSSPEKGYEYDCLLGGDFLAAVGARIDYPTLKLTFQHKESVNKSIQKTP